MGIDPHPAAALTWTGACHDWPPFSDRAHMSWPAAVSHQATATTSPAAEMNGRSAPSVVWVTSVTPLFCRLQSLPSVLCAANTPESWPLIIAMWKGKLPVRSATTDESLPEVCWPCGACAEPMLQVSPRSFEKASRASWLVVAMFQDTNTELPLTAIIG